MAACSRPIPDLAGLCERFVMGREVTCARAEAVAEPVLFQPLLIASTGGEWGTFQNDIRIHELAHYVSSLYARMENQPRWFAEGFAKYLETLRHDDVVGTVEIGSMGEWLNYTPKQSSFQGDVGLGRGQGT